MKQNVVLVVASLLSILLLTLHITDDIVRGISKAEPANIALFVFAVFLYGTLLLAERRSGHIIMLLVGLFPASMPVIHMRGAHLTPDRFPAALVVALASRAAWSQDQLIPFAKEMRVDVKAVRRQLKAARPDDSRAPAE